MTKNHTSINNIFFIGSLYQWALVRFIIVSMPLVAAIIYTGVQVTNHTQTSQRTLFQAVNATESSRIIVERLTSMERSIRQFQVLNEPEIFKAYQEHRITFLENVKLLASKELDKDFLTKLKTLQQNENQLYQNILQNTEVDPLKQTEISLNKFDQLSQQAKVLLAEGEKRVGMEAASLSVTAQHVRERLFISALASIPLAIFLGLTFVHLLTRPIKDIGQAIRNLGEEGYEKPISIDGPQDLIVLGQHLEWLRQKLNYLEHEKLQFIRNVSHELKTPLATLKEGTDLLAENVVGELNTEQQEIIQLMKIGNITINDLVENLLEYQRAISTEVDFNFSTFKLDALIERIANEYQLLLRSKNITLNSNLNTVNIRADYDKLKIIISNILSNALKFSPQNGTIGLNLNSHNNTIQLMIEDQGSGIAKEIQPFIFQDFYQGNSSQVWKIKASGLGLALVKHYLEAQKGTIKLLPATKEYCGARFSLQIPQKQGSNDATS